MKGLLARSRRRRVLARCARSSLLAACVLPLFLHAGLSNARAQPSSIAPTLLPSESGAFRPKWSYRAMGEYIGARALVVADLDADGDTEVFATAIASGGWSEGYWYTLKREGAGYRHDWIGPLYKGLIDAAVVRNIDADPALEIAVVVANQLFVYDGATRELQQGLTLAVADVTALNIADVDADGALEVVTGSRWGVYIYDLSSGREEYQNRYLDCKSLAVGNVDADAVPEIVIAETLGPGLVLNGATRATEWSASIGFGQTVRLGDVDGDGKAEIVASYDWQVIRVFDADLQAIAGTIPTSQNIDALTLLDVEGDGPLEILYADAQHGGLHAHNGSTRALKWTIEGVSGGVPGIAVGDSDGDGARELVWGFGHRSSGPDYLYVTSVGDRALEWQSLDEVGPFFGMTHGDVDADGAPELVSAPTRTDSGHGSGMLVVHNASTGAIEHRQVIASSRDTRVLGMESANVDDDPQLEIFVVGDQFDGVIICYDGLTHAEQWSYEFVGSSVGASELADVDSDGRLELIVSHGSNGYTERVTVFDAKTGAVEWLTPHFASGTPYVGRIRVANVDADPALEILVAHSNSLFVLDAVLRTTIPLSSPGILDFQMVDPDGDGRFEVVAGTFAGIVRIDPGTGGVIETVSPWTPTLPLSPDVTLVALDFDGQDGDEYVWNTGSQVVVARAGSCEIWRAPAGIGALSVTDIDGDGRKELVVGRGSAGFDVYEVDLLPKTPCTTTLREGVANGNFETGPPWSPWSTNASQSALDPFCKMVGCGFTPYPVSPFDGDAWVWFGRPIVNAASVLQQTLILPAAPRLFLRFQLRVARSSPPFTASLVVSIDGVPIQTFIEPSAPEPAYTLREVDLTAFANGAPHTLAFSYVNPDPGPAYFELDGITLAVAGGGGLPSITIEDIRIPEGQSGLGRAAFAVSLTEPAAKPVTVQYATTSDSADASDFQPATGTLMFSPGQTTRTIDVRVKGDVEGEGDETFFVDLASPLNASISDSRGRATIVNDEIAGLFIDDMTAVEGAAGALNAVFTVRLGVASVSPVTVSAMTSDRTATSPADYTATGPLTLTFPPGATVQTLTVPVAGDALLENDERFLVTLSAPVNAAIVDGEALGTILNDDLPARVFVSVAGSDDADCSIQSTPCRGLSAGIAQTAVDGEVIILTSGEYETSPLTIAKGIKITAGPGTVPFIRRPILVNAPGARVVLRGLALRGNGSGSGITLQSASAVSLEQVTIDRWSSGLRVEPDAALSLIVIESTLSGNGIGLEHSAGVAASVAVDGVRFVGNGTGISAMAGRFDLHQSAFIGHQNAGVTASSGALIQIQRSEFVSNALGLEAQPGATVTIGRSWLFANTTGLSAVAGSILNSAGTNVIRGNATNVSGAINIVSEK